jgi:hypothetical protein
MSAARGRAARRDIREDILVSVKRSRKLNSKHVSDI